MHLGLRVRRLQVRGWLRVPRYCAQLYPGVFAGMPYRGAICLLEEDCLDTDPGKVLIAMAAPSYLRTDDTKLNTYSDLEARLAFRHANKLGLSANMLMDSAARLAASCEEEIYDLAPRLDAEGVIQEENL